jgi:hypothetical protein
MVAWFSFTSEAEAESRGPEPETKPPKFWMIWIRMMMDDDLSGPMAP